MVFDLDCQNRMLGAMLDYLYPASDRLNCVICFPPNMESAQPQLDSERNAQWLTPLTT
jgi:hypothetical protein